MEEVKLKSLGMEGTGQEPSTVEEFDTIARKPGTCLTRAREYVRFHITLGEIRDVFLHGADTVAATDTTPARPKIVGVEELTGIARNTKPVLDKEGKPKLADGEPVTEFDETQGKYFDRVVATLVKDGKYSTEEEALASFQSLFDEVITYVGFPAAKAESKAKAPAKLAAKYKVAAAKVIAKGTTESVNSNQLAKIGKTFTASTVAEGETPKLYTGTYPDGQNEDGTPKQVSFSVNDKDAETLGWLIKEYFDWKAAQEMTSLG